MQIAAAIQEARQHKSPAKAGSSSTEARPKLIYFSELEATPSAGSSADLAAPLPAPASLPYLESQPHSAVDGPLCSVADGQTEPGHATQPTGTATILGTEETAREPTSAEPPSTAGTRQGSNDEEKDDDAAIEEVNLSCSGRRERRVGALAVASTSAADADMAMLPSSGDTAVEPTSAAPPSTANSNDEEDNDAPIEEVSLSSFGRRERRVRVRGGAIAAGVTTAADGDRQPRTVDKQARRKVHVAAASFMRHFTANVPKGAQAGPSSIEAEAAVSGAADGSLGPSVEGAMSDAARVLQAADELVARGGLQSGVLRDDGRGAVVPGWDVGGLSSVRERYSGGPHTGQRAEDVLGDPDFLGDVTELPLVKRKATTQGVKGWGRVAVLDNPKRPRCNGPKHGPDSPPFDYDAHAAAGAGPSQNVQRGGRRGGSGCGRGGRGRGRDRGGQERGRAGGQRPRRTGYNPFAIESADLGGSLHSNRSRGGEKSGIM